MTGLRTEGNGRNDGASEEQAYRFGGFQLLPAGRRLLHGDERVPLRPRTLSVLIALVERHDRIVTKDELYAEVWPGACVEENNLVVHVSLLRKALGAGAIATIPGRGYKFTAEIQRPGNPASTPEPLVATPVPTERDTNLPQYLTELIGREAELAELLACTSRNRLVTLAGPGGIGKTRLAVELGWRLRPRFPDGIWRVDLASLTDPSAVASAVATVLGIVLRDADDPAHVIADAVAERRILLILDNCEHLIGPVAGLGSALLQRAPGLSVLATSQEILRIPAEYVYRLDSLAVPPMAATAQDDLAAEITCFGAVALFLARARSADRNFVLDDDNAASVGEICRRLDGIPLALEMAAARLPLLGIEGLRARLGDRLEMLSVGPRTADSRHRTLRHLIEWSHGLLDAADQRVFIRLGIFPGSFSLEGAIAVAGDDGASPWASIDALGRLVDKSLVVLEAGEQPRYRLLETLRLHALEHLAAGGEAERVAARLARYVSSLFDPAYEAWENMPDAQWLDVYKPDIDTLRVAFEWAFADPGRSAMAVGLAVGSGLVWARLGLHIEGRRHLDRATTLVDLETPVAAVARLKAFSGVLWINTDRLRALALYEESAALYRRLGDQPSLALVLSLAGTAYARIGRFAEAKAALCEARDLLQSGARKKTEFSIQLGLGVLALGTDDIAEARRFFARALELARALKDQALISSALENLAPLEFATGCIESAIARAREGLAGTRSGVELAKALTNLAAYLIANGDLAEARATVERALPLARRQGGHRLRLCLQVWALIAALDGQHAEAAQLMGFVEAFHADIGGGREVAEQKVYACLRQRLEAMLPASDLRMLSAAGARLIEEDAIRLAYAAINERPQSHASDRLLVGAGLD